MTSTSAQHRWARRTGALMATIGMALMGIGALAPAVGAASKPPPTYSGPFIAESSPPPASLLAVASNGVCEGVAPTSGSLEAVTQMQLNTGQGLVKGLANDFSPGGTVHYVMKYSPTHAARSFDIVDCAVAFLPVTAGHPADNTAAILALVTGPYGQVFANPPTTTPVIKGFDQLLDAVEFSWDLNDGAVPGEFDFSYTVPPGATPGAVVCNYAKTTGGTDAGGDENRKAGACFAVAGSPTSSTTTSTTTTSTTPPYTTTTSTSPTTSASTTTSTTATTSSTTTSSTTTSTTTTFTTVPLTTTTSLVAPSTAVTTSTTASVGGAVPATPSTTQVGAVAPEVATTNPHEVLPLAVTPRPVQLPSTGSGTRDLTILAGLLLASGGLALMVAGRTSSLRSPVGR